MLRKALALLALWCMSASVPADLLPRFGGAALYDTDRDITWLADANYAKTSGFDQYGLLTWSRAQAWIASLNASNLLGASNWRLPVSDACQGFGCSGSEMGHLYYAEFGFRGDTFNQSSAVSGLFANLQTSQAYWSGTEGPFTGSRKAWAFYFANGMQSLDGVISNGNLYALAVRNGDISPIPEPGAGTFLLVGLVLVIARMRCSGERALIGRT